MKQPVNIPASVHHRLLALSKQRGEDFNHVLRRYGIEGLLRRLAASKYASRFVLKGAMLLAAWREQPHRPTKDLDLLGYDASSAGALMAVFQEICRVEVEPDGLVFDDQSIQVEAIREAQQHGGQRLKVTAHRAEHDEGKG